MKRTVFALGFLFVFAGCQKAKVDPSDNKVNGQNLSTSIEMPMQIPFYKGYFAGFHGSIGFNLQRDRGDYTTSSISCGAYFENPTLDIDRISVGGLELSSANTVKDGHLHFGLRNAMHTEYTLSDLQNVKNLFGKNVRFLANSGSRSSGVNIDDEIYVPQSLNLSVTDQTKMPRVNRTQGLQLNWDKDINNQHGVAIVLLWEGKKVGADKMLIEDNKAVRVQNLTIVEDDGSYSLQAADFKDMPKDAWVLVSVVRGNYKYVTSQGQNFQLSAFDMQNVDITLND